MRVAYWGCQDIHAVLSRNEFPRQVRWQSPVFVPSELSFPVDVCTLSDVLSSRWLKNLQIPSSTQNNLSNDRVISLMRTSAHSFIISRCPCGIGDCSPAPYSSKDDLYRPSIITCRLKISYPTYQSIAKTCCSATSIQIVTSVNCNPSGVQAV